MTGVVHSTEHALTHPMRVNQPKCGQSSKCFCMNEMTEEGIVSEQNAVSAWSLLKSDFFWTSSELPPPPPLPLPSLVSFFCCSFHSFPPEKAEHSNTYSLSRYLLLSFLAILSLSQCSLHNFTQLGESETQKSHNTAHTQYTHTQYTQQILLTQLTAVYLMSIQPK